MRHLTHLACATCTICKRGVGIFFFIAISLNSLAVSHPKLNHPIDPVWKIRLTLSEGREIVQYLRENAADESTTSYRREQKAVVDIQQLNQVLQVLTQGNPAQGIQPIQFQEREMKDPSDTRGLLPGNFTFYGRSASFQNDSDRFTSIRMRARIYAQFNPDMSGLARAPATRDSVFLEIKIKNPVESEPEGVHKYRINLRDEDVLALFRSDPSSNDFESTLQQIESHALALGTKLNTPQRVHALLKVIHDLAQRDPSFIHPLFVTAYTRQSFSFTDPKYPTPEVPAAPKKERHRLNLFRHPMKTPAAIETLEAEFQLTLDRNVRAYRALIAPEDTVLDIQRYFNPEDPAFMSRIEYPQNATVVEFKEPGKVAQLRMAQKTPTHRWFDETLISFMKRDHLAQFLFNHGKASHLTRMLRKELLRPYRTTDEFED